MASYNNIPFETGLTIGQVLKIPAKKSMAPIAETAAPAKPAPATVKPTEQSKGSHPVYHTVVKSEGLYGISKRYNVTIDEIKKWNNLNSDGLVEGMQLIVGKNGSTPATVAATPEKEEPVQVKATEIKQATPVHLNLCTKPRPAVKVLRKTKGWPAFLKAPAAGKMVSITACTMRHLLALM